MSRDRKEKNPGEFAATAAVAAAAAADRGAHALQQLLLLLLLLLGVAEHTVAANTAAEGLNGLIDLVLGVPH